MSAADSTRLLQLLSQARTLAHELDVTITRQDVAGAPGGGTGGTPWPFDLAASEARAELLKIVGELVDPGQRPATLCNAGDDTTMLMLAAARAVYRQPPDKIDDRIDRLTRAVRKGWQAIDRRPDRRRIGRCGCGADVLARDEQTTVVCRYCGAEHDAAEQRARLLASARGIEVTVGGAVDAFTALGVKVTRGMVEGWIRRGHVTVSSEAWQAPRYSMGDLMGAWERVNERRLPGTPGAP